MQYQQSLLLEKKFKEKEIDVTVVDVSRLNNWTQNLFLSAVEHEKNYHQFFKYKQPGSNFFGKTPLFFQYSGVNAANAVNLQAKRR